MMNWNSALALSTALRDGTFSSVDVMNETYDRIEKHKPQLNAIVNLLPREEALKLAHAADQIEPSERGDLHGIPMAVKDLNDVAGFPTTAGYIPYKDQIIEKDGPMAARLRQAGALFIGKTNTPELGLGSQTYNSVFGTTLNPYDQTRTPGGSSGGAAVAIVTEMLAIADGSDMGGSLRNPASFCNIVGMRPSIGRVPSGGHSTWFGRMSTAGPMARTVKDATYLLSVQAGPHSSDPLTLPESGTIFKDLLSQIEQEPSSPYRIAYSPNLHGLPIASEVSEVIAQAPAVFEDFGWEITETSPDLSKAMEVFQIQRAAGLANLGRTLDSKYTDWRTHTKDTALWNIDEGMKLSSQEILESEQLRAEIYANVAAFFETYDALILPAAQVAPFDIETQWIEEIEGVKFPTYLDWMTVCCAISITSLPTISVPGGFTTSGLPVGLQIVGKPKGDIELLKIAYAFEQATMHHLRKPN